MFCQYLDSLWSGVCCAVSRDSVVHAVLLHYEEIRNSRDNGNWTQAFCKQFTIRSCRSVLVMTNFIPKRGYLSIIIGSPEQKVVFPWTLRS